MNQRGMFNIISTIIVILVIGFLVFYFVNKDDSSELISVDEEVISTANIIHITDNGFSPNEIVIKKGESISWINDDMGASWPASATHPTHLLYPGSDIEKCGTSEQSKIFDSCKGIQSGERWSFTFNEIGSWGYHDHLNPNNFGKIIVE